MEMTLDRRQFRAIFLFELTMGHKTAETTRSINNAFDPGTTNEHTYSAVVVQEVLQRRRQREDEKHSGWPLGVDNNNGEASSKLILLQLQEKLPQNSTATILRSFSV